MNMTPRPQATRLTFVLLTFVMIGFGLFAERHVESSEHHVNHTQTSISTTAAINPALKFITGQ